MCMLGVFSGFPISFLCTNNSMQLNLPFPVYIRNICKNNLQDCKMSLTQLFRHFLNCFFSNPYQSLYVQGFSSLPKGFLCINIPKDENLCWLKPNLTKISLFVQGQHTISVALHLGLGIRLPGWRHLKRARPCPLRRGPHNFRAGATGEQDQPHEGLGGPPEAILHPRAGATGGCTEDSEEASLRRRRLRLEGQEPRQAIRRTSPCSTEER